MASKAFLAAVAVAVLLGLAAAEPNKHDGHSDAHTIKQKIGIGRLSAGIDVSLHKKNTRSIQNVGITSYDVINKKPRGARSISISLGVGAKIGAGGKPLIAANLVKKQEAPASRPKRFFGLHRHPKVIVVHSHPAVYPTSYVHPPPQLVYIRKHHRHHHHHHQHRPKISVHFG